MTTSSLQLGMRPETLRVLLTTGADFLCVLRLNDDWPVGTVLTLEVGNLIWTATISGADATFAVDKAVTALVSDNDTARLVYTNGTTDQVWAVGTAVVSG